jgi:hypothetical protein
MCSLPVDMSRAPVGPTPTLVLRVRGVLVKMLESLAPPRYAA